MLWSLGEAGLAGGLQGEAQQQPTHVLRGHSAAVQVVTNPNPNLNPNPNPNPNPDPDPNRNPNPNPNAVRGHLLGDAARRQRLARRRRRAVL